MSRVSSSSKSPNSDTAVGAICRCERLSFATVSRRFRMRESWLLMVMNSLSPMRIYFCRAFWCIRSSSFCSERTCPSLISTSPSTSNQLFFGLTVICAALLLTDGWQVILHPSAHSTTQTSSCSLHHWMKGSIVRIGSVNDSAMLSGIHSSSSKKSSSDNPLLISFMFFRSCFRLRTSWNFFPPRSAIAVMFPFPGTKARLSEARTEAVS